MNLLLYAEARECLAQLHTRTGGDAPRSEHPLSYPEELFADLARDDEAPAAADKWLDELFDGRFAQQAYLVF
jgi:hypothetical protein